MYKPNVYVNVNELALEKKEIQIEEMRNWFFENYQDPVNACPFESSSGGYYFIWGGPYEAKDVLYQEFGSIIDENIIDELATELDQITIEWYGLPVEYPDENEYELAIQNRPYTNLLKSKQEILSILEQNGSNQYLVKMLFAWTITALETYLSETFKIRILTKDQYIKNFVENNTDFSRETIKLKEIFEKKDNLKSFCITYLNDIMWHKLQKKRKPKGRLYANMSSLQTATSTSADSGVRQDRRLKQNARRRYEPAYTKAISKRTEPGDVPSPACERITRGDKRFAISML